MHAATSHKQTHKETTPSARKQGSKQTQAQNATQATQQTPPAQPATHATQPRRNRPTQPALLRAPPHPRPTRQKGKCAERHQGNSSESASATLWTSALAVRTGPVQLALSFVHTLSLAWNSHWFYMPSWTTHWVNTLCWLSQLDSTSDQRAADAGLVEAACESLPCYTRKDRGKAQHIFQCSSAHSPSIVGHRRSIDPHCLALHPLPVSFLAGTQASVDENPESSSCAANSETCSGCSPRFQQC